MLQNSRVLGPLASLSRWLESIDDPVDSALNASLSLSSKMDASRRFLESVFKRSGSVAKAGRQRAKSR